MNMKEEDPINRALDSLKGIQRAKAPSQTFAKIQQKLADQRANKGIADPQPNYAWIRVAAAMALLVASNIWAVSNYWVSDSNTATESGGYAQLMTDFNLYDNE